MCDRQYRFTMPCTLSPEQGIAFEDLHLNLSNPLVVDGVCWHTFTKSVIQSTICGPKDPPISTISETNFFDNDENVFETPSRYQTLYCVGLRSPIAGSAGPVLQVKRISKPREPVRAVVDFQCVDFRLVEVGLLVAWIEFRQSEVKRALYRHALTHYLHLL